MYVSRVRVRARVPSRHYRAVHSASFLTREPPGSPLHCRDGLVHFLNFVPGTAGRLAHSWRSKRPSCWHGLKTNHTRIPWRNRRIKRSRAGEEVCIAIAQRVSNARVLLFGFGHFRVRKVREFAMLFQLQVHPQFGRSSCIEMWRNDRFWVLIGTSARRPSISQSLNVAWQSWVPPRAKIRLCQPCTLWRNRSKRPRNPVTVRE